MRHRCGRDCPVCEEIAEQRADPQPTPSEREEGERRAQDRYERHYFGRDN